MNTLLPVLVLTDNPHIADKFRALVKTNPELATVDFDYRCSPASEVAMGSTNIRSLNVKQDWEALVGHYSLIVSAHCKQLFPAGLVHKVRCVNIHPGLNPYNRGWFPQVFSILNKLPLGATIHEIDTELDHGPIIVQKQVQVLESDTSLTAYKRVQDAEFELLEKHLASIVRNDYQTTKPLAEGNLNLKKDYDALCEIDLAEIATVGQVLDRLRALTHGSYRNAFFRNAEGRRVYVSVVLEPENNVN